MSEGICQPLRREQKCVFLFLISGLATPSPPPLPFVSEPSDHITPSSDYSVGGLLTEHCVFLIEKIFRLNRLLDTGSNVEG